MLKHAIQQSVNKPIDKSTTKEIVNQCKPRQIESVADQANKQTCDNKQTNNTN